MTKHADKRLDQRVKDSLIISIPLEARKYIRDNGLNNAELTVGMQEMIKSEFQKRLDNRVLGPDFTTGAKRVFILLEAILKIGESEYPITLTVTSVDVKSDGRVVEKTLTGRKLVVIVGDNKVITIFAADGTKHDIARAAEAHDERMARSSKIMTFDSEPFTIELNGKGELSEYTGRTGGSNTLTKAEREYALAPGRMIKVFLPFMGGMTESEVIEVLNRNSARADGFVKVAVQIEDGRKIPKTLKPGDPVSIPTKDGNWEQFSVADSLFVDYAHRGGAFSLKLI